MASRCPSSNAQIHTSVHAGGIASALMRTRTCAATVLPVGIDVAEALAARDAADARLVGAHVAQPGGGRAPLRRPRTARRSARSVIRLRRRGGDAGSGFGHDCQLPARGRSFTRRADHATGRRRRTSDGSTYQSPTSTRPSDGGEHDRDASGSPRRSSTNSTALRIGDREEDQTGRGQPRGDHRPVRPSGGDGTASGAPPPARSA